MTGHDATPDILLVDDDDDLRHALRQGLELDDLTVADFKNPADALSAIRRDFSGAVVSDIRMPGIDGMQSGGGRHIGGPVLVVGDRHIGHPAGILEE